MSSDAAIPGAFTWNASRTPAGTGSDSTGTTPPATSPTTASTAHTAMVNTAVHTPQAPSHQATTRGLPSRSNRARSVPVVRASLDVAERGRGCPRRTAPRPRRTRRRVPDVHQRVLERHAALVPAPGGRRGRRIGARGIAVIQVAAVRAVTVPRLAPPDPSAAAEPPRSSSVSPVDRENIVASPHARTVVCARLRMSVFFLVLAVTRNTPYYGQGNQK